MTSSDGHPVRAGGGVLGSGLPLTAYVGLIAIATVVFLFWDGPLWSAPGGTSHVQRIIISYALIVPLAGVALLGLGRFTWTRLVTASGTAWAFKLLITALLYYGLARGTAIDLEAKAIEPTAEPALVEIPAIYVAALPGFSGGTVGGVVSAADQPVPQAVVYLEHPPPGRPLDPPRDVRLTIHDNRYARALQVVTSVDAVSVSNTDGVLHLVHVHGWMGDTSSGNTPVPPGRTGQPLRVPAPGLHTITCDNHDQERSWLLSVDHPYFTATDAGGRFTLTSVALDDVTVAAAAVIDARLWLATVEIPVTAADNGELRLALAPQP